MSWQITEAAMTIDARLCDLESALVDLRCRVSAIEHRIIGEQIATNRAAMAGEQQVTALEARVAALEAQITASDHR